MKTTLTFMFFFIAFAVHAQGDYLVKTTSQSKTAGSEEEQFLVNNFPFYSICDWKAGQKFLFVGEDKYSFMPLLNSYATGREVSNSKMQYKILEFLGTEEVEKESYVGKSFSTRFMFENEGEKYYYEVKNQHLSDICAGNSRALIHNLVFLGDVDVARELLLDKTLYLKVATAKVDDTNTGSGYREVKIPKNMEVTVTAVGAGNRECPVKLVFEDREGNSYYRDVMFSRTNSGMLETDLVGSNIDKYFPNVFSFVDKEMKTSADIRSKYVGRAVYPKNTIQATTAGAGLQPLLRYTPLVIKDMTVNGTNATLKLADRSGTNYTVDVDLKYDIFVRNENYIDDMFGYGDLRKQYPSITEETWVLLSKGEVKTGMSKDECRLALGSPIQIVANMNSRYETWYYNGRILEFDEGKLLRIK